MHEQDNPELVFIATGSEVSLAIDTANNMKDNRIRVVSMPCWEIYENQSNSEINLIFSMIGYDKLSIQLELFNPTISIGTGGTEFRLIYIFFVPSKFTSSS